MITRIFVIGLAAYKFPPDPEIGDIEALKNWKPVKLSSWQAILLRIKLKIYRYSVKVDLIS